MITGEWQVSWWEYVRDEKGALTYGPEKDGISSCLMRNISTGEVVETPALPYAACYATHDPYDGYRKGPDGLSIIIICPCERYAGQKSTWVVDGKCSNCTLPGDKEHYCWVRHGTVGDRLTVNKDGHTCAAGGGSILMDGFHGMLTDGVLKSI